VRSLAIKIGCSLAEKVFCGSDNILDENFSSIKKPAIALSKSEPKNNHIRSPIVDTVGCVAIDNLQLKSQIWQRRTIADMVGCVAINNL
jgi:hypothetical protein